MGLNRNIVAVLNNTLKGLALRLLLLLFLALFCQPTIVSDFHISTGQDGESRTTAKTVKAGLIVLIRGIEATNCRIYMNTPCTLLALRMQIGFPADLSASSVRTTRCGADAS